MEIADSDKKIVVKTFTNTSMSNSRSIGIKIVDIKKNASSLIA